MTRHAAETAAKLAQLQREPDFDETLMTLTDWLVELMARRHRGEVPQTGGEERRDGE